MNDEQRKALQCSLPLICRDVDTDGVIPFLATLLNDFQIEQLEAIKRKDTRNGNLVRMICTAGPKAFDLFLHALKMAGKQHVAEEIFSHLPISHLASHRGSLGSDQNSKINVSENCQPIEVEKMSVDVLAAELKEIYLKRLRRFNPFSLPFTFDIEKSWIALGLRQDATGIRKTKNKFIRVHDHCQLINEAFSTDPRLLLIEGRAASGKTSLMRRIAYDWAKGKLNQYKLVLLVEIRHLPNINYETMAELVLSCGEVWGNVSTKILDELKKVFFSTDNNTSRFLVLLDGYDEGKSKNIFNEFTTYLRSLSPLASLCFSHDIIISTRPGPLTMYNKETSRLKYAQVLGFDKASQRNAYINAHFSGTVFVAKMFCYEIGCVKTLLEENEQLKELAKTPLFLTFICLVHEHLKDGSIFELYRCMIWWLIDRYQKDHPDLDVPFLFGWKKTDEEFKDDVSNLRIIQDCFLEFPLLQTTGRLALENIADSTFSNALINKHDSEKQTINSGILLRDEYRDGLKMLTRYLFPHRTIQEFFAGGCFYFWSGNPETEKTIETFLCKEKKYQEMENFIFCSISSQNISSGLRRYIEGQIELDIPASAFQCTTDASYETDILNEILGVCKNVRKLTVKRERTIRDTCMTKPLDLKNQAQTLECINLEFVKFDFELSLQQSILSVANDSINLRKVELAGIAFPSSVTLACTMNTLKKNLHQRATLSLSAARIKMNTDEGLNELEIMSDSHPLSSFVRLTDVSRLSFSTELDYVLNYLLSIRRVNIYGNDDYSAFSLCKMLHFINLLPFLEKASYVNLSLYFEEKMAKDAQISETSNDGKTRIVELVNFWKCNFRAEDDIAKLMNYLTKQFRHSPKAVIQVTECRTSFSRFDNDVRCSTKLLRLSKYSVDWTDCLKGMLIYKFSYDTEVVLRARAGDLSLKPKKRNHRAYHSV